MISEEKKAYNRKYYLENIERLKEQNREYREKNLEHLTKLAKENYQENKEERRAQQAEYNTREEVVLRVRERHLSENGWTLERYEEKKKEFNDLCEICKIPTAPRALGGILVADHEHIEPPMPRGLLCTRCNTGLGQFLDNPLLLIEAAAYLAKYTIKKATHV